MCYTNTIYYECKLYIFFGAIVYVNVLAITSKGAYYDLSIKSRNKLKGMFLSVGIVRLLNVIILQFATLKFFERRMIL